MHFPIPAWKIVIGLVIIALISFGIALAIDTVDPSPAHSQTRSHTHQRAPIKPILKDPKVWGSDMGYQKTHGKLGNSQGRWLPQKVIHRLNAYKDKHPRVPDWWSGAMGKAECFWNGDLFPGPVITDVAFCMKYGDNPTIHAINKKITAIKLGCQAGMVVGAFSGTAFGVLGAGAAGCAFTGYATTILDSPYFRPVRPGAHALK